MATQKNDLLYEKALQAINDLFSDTSVSVGDCRANLKSLIEEIKIMLESLDLMSTEEDQ